MTPAIPAIIGTPPADLHPEARKIVDLYDRMRGDRDEFGMDPVKPNACFRDLPPSEQLTYESLNWSNYQVLLHLFQADKSPFVMPPFKSRQKLDQYAAIQLATGRYSGKRGIIDWLIANSDGIYIGVLHLYNVSFEIWDDKRQPCMCGYAIARPFRRKGYAEEALLHLLSRLPIDYKLFEAQAEPLQANIPSRTLLEKTGFTFKKNHKNHWGPSALYHKKLVDEIPKISFEDLEELY